MPKSKSRRRKSGGGKSARNAQPARKAQPAQTAKSVDWGQAAAVGSKTPSPLRRYAWVAVAVAAVAGLGYWTWDSIAAERSFVALAEAGQPGLSAVQTHVSRGRQHVRPGTPLTYDSEFPTSGPHYPYWTVTGVYDRPQPKPELIHALEHGNVVVYYDDPAPEAWENLVAWADLYEGQWDGMVVTKWPGLGKEVVMTAWVKELRLEKWDAELAAAFIDAFRGRGPENPVR